MDVSAFEIFVFLLKLVAALAALVVAWYFLVGFWIIVIGSFEPEEEAAPRVAGRGGPRWPRIPGGH